MTFLQIMITLFLLTNFAKLETSQPRQTARPGSVGLYNWGPVLFFSQLDRGRVQVQVTYGLD